MVETNRDLEKSMKDKDEKDKDEEGQPLELDKLDVSSITLPPPKKLPRLEGERDKGEAVSSSRVSTIWSVLVFVSKEKMFICAFLLGLLVTTAVVYLFLTKSSSDGLYPGDSYVGTVVYVISSPVADGYYVRFKLSIPFKDDKEKADLMQKLPTIKQKLSLSGSSSGVVQSIEKKDLKTLKEHILKIVNEELTSVPIEVLHLEELTLGSTDR